VVSGASRRAADEDARRQRWNATAARGSPAMVAEGDGSEVDGSPGLPLAALLLR